MESLIWLGVYLLGFFVVFGTVLVWIAKDRAGDNSSDENYFLVGLLACLISVIWPLSIFGMLSVPVCKYYNEKVLRERELTRELSRG